MKRITFNLMLLFVIAIAVVRCSDDSDVEKKIPEVSPVTVVEVKENTVLVKGKIEDNGGNEIVMGGFVYSSIVSNPTVADDKVEVGDTGDEFEALLDGLTPSTKYYIRVFAENDIGVGYGPVVQFTTGNAAPTASSLSISGRAEANMTLNAIYEYEDYEGDEEGESLIQWYEATTAAGVDEVEIVGANETSYVVQESQQGKYIRFGVTPIAVGGSTVGVEIKSAFIGAVGEATTVTFMYNGGEVTYGIIASPSGRKWLDRNLGAPETPDKVNDFENYGDLFQWGRGADGHQIIIRTGLDDSDMSGKNGQTSDVAPYETSSADDPGHSKFIINFSFVGDWRVPQNGNLWQGVDGINNPCPAGWRIPTQAEWLAENLENLQDAFEKLNITYTGVRAVDTGAFFQSSTNGNYWTSTEVGSDPFMATRIRINDTFTTLDAFRGNGYACRCIKD